MSHVTINGVTSVHSVTCHHLVSHPIQCHINFEKCSQTSCLCGSKARAQEKHNYGFITIAFIFVTLPLDVACLFFYAASCCIYSITAYTDLFLFLASQKLLSCLSCDVSSEEEKAALQAWKTSRFNQV